MSHRTVPRWGMLNALDDYPIHQTPEPIAHPASSDRNVYDRTWFNGFTAAGDAYFALGMAIYPHRGVLDAAFSTVTAEGIQHAFFVSRRAPDERTDLSAGPFRLEITEPLRRTRVILDDNDSGLACDLEFSALTAPIQEARQTLWNGNRPFMDATRFDQFGRWSGTITTPDGEIHVDEWHGTKDRSWGIRGVGEPETGGAPRHLAGIHFFWTPLFWDDHISHAIFFDGPNGEPLVNEGLTAPLFGQTADIPAELTPLDTRMARAAHRIVYVPGSRLAASADVDLIALDGHIRTITMEPLLRFQMKGLGYGHPKWRQGSWLGELVTGSERYVLAEIDLSQPENFHTQQIVRATDSEGNVGIGVLEQITVGAHAPSGFSSFSDLG